MDTNRSVPHTWAIISTLPPSWQALKFIGLQPSLNSFLIAFTTLSKVLFTVNCVFDRLRNFGIWLYRGIRGDDTRINSYSFNRFNYYYCVYMGMERIYYYFFGSEGNFGVDDDISRVGRGCWQFEFSHVLGELLCEARNVFLRALKKQDGRGKHDVLSFISYFSSPF